MAGAFNWNGPTPMGLASYVQQQGDFGRQRGEDSRLARLVSGAMADPSKRQANVAEIASFRPEAAFQAQGQFDQQEDVRNRRLGEMATIYVGAPASQKAAILRQFAPELTKFGMQIGPDLAPSPEIDQMAQQLARVYGGADGGGSGMFSQKVGADGYIYNTDRQGNITNTGVKADRQMWFANNEGVDPYLTDKDGNVRMVGGGPAPAQVPPTQEPSPQLAGSGGDPKADAITAAANAMIKAGVPEAQVDAFIQQSMAAAGLNPQPAPTDSGAMLPTSGGGGGPAPSGAPVAPPAPAQGDISRVPINDLGGGAINPLRRPAKQAAGTAPPSGYRWSADGSSLEKIPGGPADRIPEADRATAAEVKEATARRLKMPQIANLERGLANIEAAIASLDDNMIGTGPATGSAIGLTEEGQSLETSVGAIQESLLSLTRVPGIGAQSDLEARIAGLKYPQLGNYASNNRTLLNNLRSIVTDIKAAYESLRENDDAVIESRSRQGQQGQPAQQPAASTGWGIQKI